MKILSIGNSFSQDAQRYIHKLAEVAGLDICTVNLYIGGCSLARHHQNMTTGERAYALEVNGESTGFYTGIKEALALDHFDVVTFQQVSQEAPRFETYQPYLSALSQYVKELSPTSRQWFHETWAYEAGSARLTKELSYTAPAEMLADVKSSAEKAKAAIGAAGIIPSGDAMLRGNILGLSKLHRDTFHADWGIGRYLLACTWITALTGFDMRTVNPPALDVPCDKWQRDLAAQAAWEAVSAL